MIERDTSVLLHQPWVIVICSRSSFHEQCQPFQGQQQTEYLFFDHVARGTSLLALNEKNKNKRRLNRLTAKERFYLNQDQQRLRLSTSLLLFLVDFCYVELEKKITLIIGSLSSDWTNDYARFDFDQSLDGFFFIRRRMCGRMPQFDNFNFSINTDGFSLITSSRNVSGTTWILYFSVNFIVVCARCTTLALLITKSTDLSIFFVTFPPNWPIRLLKFLNFFDR